MATYSSQFSLDQFFLSQFSLGHFFLGLFFGNAWLGCNGSHLSFTLSRLIIVLAPENLIIKNIFFFLFLAELCSYISVQRVNSQRDSVLVRNEPMLTIKKLLDEMISLCRSSSIVLFFTKGRCKIYGVPWPGLGIFGG